VKKCHTFCDSRKKMDERNEKMDEAHIERN
jgi:hypothetical protein